MRRAPAALIVVLGFALGLALAWQLSRGPVYGSHASFDVDDTALRTPRWTGTAHTVGYSYDDQHRLLATSDGGRLSYDDSGRVTRLEREGGALTLVWNKLEQLAEVRFDDGTKTRYGYDRAGRLVARTDRRGHTTRFAYDGLNLIEERADDGSVLASYVYAQTLDHPVLMVTEDGPRVLVYDRMGSVVAVTDLKGKVLARYRYDAWGNPVEERASIRQPFRFAGYLWDPDAKLYLLRARWYDPSLGRLLSPDPVVPASLDPQDWNAYAYGRNDPANRTDPLGLASEPWWGPMSSEYLGYLRWRAGWMQFYLRKSWDNWLQVYEVTRDALFRPKVIQAPLPPPVGPAVYYARRAKKLLAVGPPAVLALAHSWVVAFDAVGMVTDTVPVAAFGAGYHFDDIRRGARVVQDVTSGPLRTAAELSGRGSMASLHNLGLALRNANRAVPPTGLLQREPGNLGGILLNRSASALADLTDVRGAIWDRDRRQLVLVGREDRRLPPTRLDDLITAIEAVYDGRDVGVSIDPGRRHGTMAVRYLPDTIRGTHLGEVLFEADRLLKVLSMGRDNVTGSPVRSSVPGYRSELDLAAPSIIDVGRSVWHRMWFVPKTLSLREHDGAFVYDDAQIALKTQYFNPGSRRVSRSGSDPAAKKFVAHLEDNYGAYAREHPILAELLQAAKLVGLVKWLRRNAIHIDVDRLEDSRPSNARTPATTPAGTVSRTVADGSWLVTLGLYGGVDLSPAPKTEPDASVGRLRTAALGGRPSVAAPSWRFRWRGRSWTAVAVSLASSPTPGGLTWSDVDLDLTGGAHPELSLARHFDSRRPQRGGFGRAWAAVPFSLEFPLTYARRMYEPVIEFEDHVAGSTTRFRLGAGRRGYVATSGAPITLALTDLGYVVRRAGEEIKFHDDGRLVQAAVDGTVVRYRWRGNSLIRITSNGRRLVLTYGDRRVRIAHDHTGRVVRYDYDAAGNLVAVRDEQGTRARYAYDAAGRLVSATGPEGDVAFAARYDALGRQQSREPGGWRYRWSPDGRTVSVRAGGERAGTIRFGPDASVSALTATDGSRWQLEQPQPGITEMSAALGAARITIVRDAAGRPRTLSDADGGTTRLEYDRTGRVSEVADGYEARSLAATYDGNGALASVRDGDGVIAAFGREGRKTSVRVGSGGATVIGQDALGRPTTLVTPSDEVTKLRWDARDRLVEVRDGLMGLRVQRTGRGGVELVDGEGRALRYVSGPDGRLREVRDDEGASIRLGYDGAGELDRLTGPDGRTVRPAASEPPAAGGGPDAEFDASGLLVRSRGDDGRDVRYAYTAAGRLTAIRYPGSGLRVRYAYDDRGLLRSIALGRDAPIATFKRDADGRVVGLRAGDVALSLAYVSGTVPSRITAKAGGASIFDGAYEYNGAGQVARETGTHDTRAYHYDRAGRLATTRYAGAYTETVAYDPAGNRRLVARVQPGDNGLLEAYEQLDASRGTLYPRSNRYLGATFSPSTTRADAAFARLVTTQEEIVDRHLAALQAVEHRPPSEEGTESARRQLVAVLTRALDAEVRLLGRWTRCACTGGPVEARMLKRANALSKELKAAGRRLRLSR